MIELKSCQKIYSNGNIGIQDVQLTLPNHGLIGIYGKSGSGKSTLINCMGGLDRFTEGSVILNGEELPSLNLYATFVFQEYKLIEELTVEDNLLIACPHVQKEKIDALLNKMELLPHKRNLVNSISGGQRQRIEIIRSVLQDSDILLCDEPLANLDEENQQIVLNLFKELSREKLILIVSHNRDILETYIEDYIVIQEGKIIENHISSGISDEKEFTPRGSIGLSFKYSALLAFNNIRKNKLKAIITFLFLFLSMTMLAVLLTILSINLGQMFNDCFEEKNVSYFTLRPFDDTKKYPSFKNVTEEQIQQIEPEIISYENVNFYYTYQDKSGEENSGSISTIWVSTTYQSQYEIANDEVYISSSMAQFLGATVNETIGVGNHRYLTIKGILSEETEEFIFLMNEATFSKLQGNLLSHHHSINVVKDEQGKEIQNIMVYNPYSEEEHLSIYKGREPQTSTEIAIPKFMLEQYHLTEENALGKTITLRVKTDDIVSLEYQIVGLSGYFVISSSEFENFIGSYSTARLNTGRKGMVLLHFSKQFFQRAIAADLCPDNSFTNDVLFIYYMLKGFTTILSVLAGIFALIAILTIFNSTNTSMIKNKKNIGVFISFKIKKSSVMFSYWLESLMVGMGVILVVYIVYPLILWVLNLMIERQWNFDFHFLRMNYWVVPIILIGMFLVTVLGIILPFKNLVRKAPIDILYERA